MEEIWKEYKCINKGYQHERTYLVSNLGRIMSVSKFGKKRILSIKYEHGYVKCCDGYMHRIVAKVFVPNPDNKPCVDHIDGNKTNNSCNNLRWVTYSENMLNENTKGTWYSNGIKEILVNANEAIPKGFIKGRLPFNWTNLGKHWWNNGIVEVNQKECPEGFVAGRLKYN